MNQPTDDPLLDKIRTELDQSVAHLDGATESRLNQARHRALEAATPRRRFGWLSAGGLATTAALVLAAGIWMRTPVPAPDDSIPDPGLQPVVQTDSALSDLELLASSEDLDLLADLDFYLWLEGELEEQG